MSLVEWLAADPARCEHGYHRTAQRCPDCPSDEWSVFTQALRAAARGDTVRQRDVRPLVRGRIEAKHIGLNYRRAIREGLLREVDRERSNDEAGRNTNKYEPVYQLRSTA